MFADRAVIGDSRVAFNLSILTNDNGQIRRQLTRSTDGLVTAYKFPTIKQEFVACGTVQLVRYLAIIQ
jgi:hypothetical protein